MNELTQYMRERIGPKIIFFALIISFYNIHFHWMNHLQMMAMILLFRFYDDLLDLKFDRVFHSERTLAQSTHHLPYIFFAAVLNIFLILSMSKFQILFFGLYSLLWFQLLNAIPSQDRFLRAIFGGTKYFAFFFILERNDPALNGTLAYLSVLLFDFIDDPKLRNSELTLLTSMALFLLVMLKSMPLQTCLIPIFIFTLWLGCTKFRKTIPFVAVLLSAVALYLM